MSSTSRLFLFAFLATALLLVGCSSEESTTPGPTPQQDGYLYVVAGKVGEAGGGGNGGAATEATLYWPQDALVANGEIYIVDWNNHCVRRIDANGMITRHIGSGLLGDDINEPAGDIDLNHPTGLSMGIDGNLYLAAWHNWKVKKIDAASMQVTAPVGTLQGNLGDGGPATAAKLDLPSSVVFDRAGNMYISDQGNQKIRKVDPSGIITNLAGSQSKEKGFADGVGEAARFSFPAGPDAVPAGKIAISADEQYLYVADTENNRIRKITIATREVTTIAGTGEEGYAGDGGPALLAKLAWPTDVATTDEGDIFVADSRNNVVRKIDASGMISTVVGTGVAGSSADGTKATEAQLNLPSGVYWDESAHTLYVCDVFNQQVKKVRNP
jgi:DNA-binding beta-propeller fold protein YncE